MRSIKADTDTLRELLDTLKQTVNALQPDMIKTIHWKENPGGDEIYILTDSHRSIESIKKSFELEEKK